jgi:hypothetical protein
VDDVRAKAPKFSHKLPERYQIIRKVDRAA